MPTRRWRFAVVFLSGSLSLGAWAQDVDCVSSLGDVEVRGNLNVAASCRLTGTEVMGNVKLFAGGSLVARNARIFGNVEGKRADFLDLDRSAINGNVRVEEFVGDASTIQRTDVAGNVELRDNRSRLEIVNSDFGGRVEISRNRGGVLISGNSVEGDLRCSGNDPEPVGIGNRVDGNVRGQCRSLKPETTNTPPATPPPPTTSQPPPTTSQPPPTTSRPPPTTSRPPPTTSQPPPVTSQPSMPTNPSATSAPPTPAPATTSAPPAAAPPAASAADTSADASVLDDGGAGAFGWPLVLVLSLLAWRRAARRAANGG